MKQYMVMISLIALGIFIFRLILGPGDGSLLNAIGDVFREEIDRMAR